jgi:hypothetical protein
MLLSVTIHVEVRFLLDFSSFLITQHLKGDGDVTCMYLCITSLTLQ